MHILVGLAKLFYILDDCIRRDYILTKFHVYLDIRYCLVRFPLGLV